MEGPESDATPPHPKATSPDPPARRNHHGNLTYVSYSQRPHPRGLEQAAYLHRAVGQPPPKTAPEARRTTPARALLLSLLLPGSGHWYLGRRRVAIVYLGLCALLLLALLPGPILALLVVLAWTLLSVTATVWTAALFAWGNPPHSDQ